MTKEQMRIVIAEVCGIKPEYQTITSIGCDCNGWKSNWLITLDMQDINELGIKSCPYCKKKFGTFQRLNNCPNYPEDLNACHEMEKVLTNDQWANYLYFIIETKIIPKLTKREELHKVCNATSLQRCEAFIKTVCPERWVD